MAIFFLDGFAGTLVADLFDDELYFADPDAFWAAQNIAIAARRALYLDQGWSDVVIVPPSEHFHTWEHEKAGKRKGGRVYLDVRATGEVTIHKGYLSTRKPGAPRAATLPAQPDPPGRRSPRPCRPISIYTATPPSAPPCSNIPASLCA